MKTKPILKSLVTVGCLSASQLLAGGLPGTVIGSAGSWGNGGNTIAKVFDGNLDTYYDAADGSGDWAGLDFGSAKVITGLRYWPRLGYGNRMVGGQFQGANVANFSSGVVTLCTITAQPPDGLFSAQAITNTTAFRYVRYLGPTNGYCNVAEVEFYNTTPPIPLTLFSDFPSSGTWADPNFNDINEYYNNTLWWDNAQGSTFTQRQSGRFRQITYLESAATAAGGAYDSLTQVNSDNQHDCLLLATDPAHGQSFTWVSPNQDFAAFSAQGASVNDLQVNIDPLGAGSAAASDHWAAVVFGAAAGSVVTNAGTGVLIRNGGGYQVYDKGTSVASGNAGAWQFYIVDFQVNATNGAYKLLINGLAVYSGTHAGGYLSNNYLTLESHNSLSDTGIQNDYFQNLQISGTLPKAAANASYYISPTGNDTYAGTSTSAPWKTFARASVEQFQPGDQLLLQGGQTFNGFLNISDSGTPGSPLTVSSYGTGNATINSGGIGAISVLVVHDLTISNLTLVGSGWSNNIGDGIALINNHGFDLGPVSNIFISAVDAGGFGHRGIVTLGFINEVTITRSTLHNNGQHGIWMVGGGEGVYGSGRSRHYLIDHVNAINNYGDTDSLLWVGGGIDGSDLSGVVAQWCVVGNNGNAGQSGGALGFGFCDHVLDQYNEVYGQFGGDANGIGTEQDDHILIQYNYTHDNVSAGIDIYGDGQVTSYHTVRYNISQNDGGSRANSCCIGFTDCYMGTQVEFYNNTVYDSQTPQPPGPGGTAFWIHDVPGTNDGTSFIRNNLLITQDGLDPIEGAGTDPGIITAQGNDYWKSGYPLNNIAWSHVWYSSLADWQAGTGEELLNGQSVGLNVDPLLNNPGGAGTLGNADQLTTLIAYQLQPGSPVRSAGLDLSQFRTVWDPYNYAADPFLGKYFSTNRVDFYGNPLPPAGSGQFSIGAHQVNPVALAAPTGLSANTGFWGVALGWNPSVGATNYDVWRATVSGGPYAFVATVNGTTYTDTGTTNGATYYYVVTAQNAVGYSANSAEFSVAGVSPTVLTHRYSFNETAGSTNIIDSVGGQKGRVVGTASVDGHGHLILPGNGVTNNNYADLGANLIDVNHYNAVSFEFWLAFGSNPQWARLLSLGDTDGGGSGQQTLDYILTPSYDTASDHFEIGPNDPSWSSSQYAAIPSRHGWTGHLVLVFNPAQKSLRIYTNGVLAAANTGVSVPLNAIHNVHSWLGKSSYNVDPNCVATLDEFRVYNGALSAQQVAADYTAGPNVVPNVAPVLSAIGNQTIMAGQTLSITNVATDANAPPQTLTYSLSVSPTGAGINATSGILTWRPTMSQAPSTNTISVVVRDNGVPPLSATQSFAVTVLAPVTPVLGNLVLSNGVFSLGVSGSSGPDYVLLGATNLVPPVTWQPVQTNLAALTPFNFTIPNTNSAAGFYRVRLAP